MRNRASRAWLSAVVSLPTDFTTNLSSTVAI